MLFMVAGYLKQGAEEQLINFRNEFSEHLAQPPLVAGGALRDRDGRRKGYMEFIEAETRGRRTLLGPKPVLSGRALRAG